MIIRPPKPDPCRVIARPHPADLSGVAKLDATHFVVETFTFAEQEQEALAWEERDKLLVECILAMGGKLIEIDP